MMLPGPDDRRLSVSIQVLEHWRQLLLQPLQGSEQLRYLPLEIVSAGRDVRMVELLEQSDGRFHSGLCLCHRNDAAGWRDGLQCQAHLVEKPTPMVEYLNGLGFLDLCLGQRYFDLETSATPANDAPRLQVSPTGALGVVNGLVRRSLQSLGEAMGILQDVKQV